MDIRQPTANAAYRPDDARLVLSLYRGLMVSRHPPTMTSILIEVADRHGLTVADLEGPSRARAIAAARHEAMYQMHKTGLWSSVQIGWRVGERDHSTALHGIKRHRQRIGDGA